MHVLRKAVLADIDAMAYVHAASWQETYKGLLDDSVIDKFNSASRKKMWTEFLQKETDSQRAYVVIVADQIVGIASWKETADQVELLTLYVLSSSQHLGIGTFLFAQVAQDAAAKSKHLITWVLKGNPAISFYEKMGLKLIKIEEKRVGSVSVEELMLSTSLEEKVPGQF